MIRLGIIVEGRTEERFVRDTLGPHLAHHGVYAFPTQVGTPKRRGGARLHKGGGDWPRWERDIRRVLGENSGADFRATTLFDLYGLPRGFPGLDEHASAESNARCDMLQKELGALISDRRFIPYLQRHEFETLVLAALPSLRDLFDAEDDLVGVMGLERDVAGVCVEDVNDGKETAPSKRLLRLVPGYQKAVHGPYAVELAGLSTVRQRCPRFDAWVSVLEHLNQ